MASISLFFISTILLFVMLFIFPKRKERINAVEWSIIMLISVIGIWAFLAGCINQLGIKINLISLSVINLVITVMLAGYTIRRKKVQTFFIHWYDLVMLAVLLVLTIVIGQWRFGDQLQIFNYNSDDSVRHFYNSKLLFESGNLENKRYVMNLLDMIFIQCRYAFTGQVSYQAFIAADLFVWFLMGSAFYAMFCRFSKGKFDVVVTMVMTLLYTLGYPLNNMLFGFEYLGMGLLMISYLIWIIWENEYLRLPIWMNISMLCLANTGLFLSYTQFVPAVCLGEAVYLVFYYFSGKEKKPLTFLLTALLGIGIPGILCVMYIMPDMWNKLSGPVWLGLLVLGILIAGLYVYFRRLAKKNQTTVKEQYQRALHHIFRQNKTVWLIMVAVIVAIGGFLAYRYIYIGLMLNYTVTGLVADGSIYRDPYANLLPFIFPVVLYVLDCIRTRKNALSLWILCGVLLESVWLLRYIYLGIFGTYYFYKMHYLLWLMMMAVTLRLLIKVSGERQKMLRVYWVLVVCLAVSSMTNWESKLTQHQYYMWPDQVSNRVFGIYDYNRRLLEHGGNVNESMQEIYNKAGEMVLENQEIIPYFGDDARHLIQYYYYLTNQIPEWYRADWNRGEDPEEILYMMEQSGIRHIFVAADYCGPASDEFYSMPICYETEYGYIIELDYNK